MNRFVTFHVLVQDENRGRMELNLYKEEGFRVRATLPTGALPVLFNKM